MHKGGWAPRTPRSNRGKEETLSRSSALGANPSAWGRAGRGKAYVRGRVGGQCAGQVGQFHISSILVSSWDGLRIKDSPESLTSGLVTT